MPARSRAEVVDPAQLLQLLSDPEWSEAPLTEGANPAVVVDVSDARELSWLAGAEPDPGRVLIGFTSEPPAGPAPPLLDVALCSGGAPAPGWVAVPDLAAAVGAVADTCEATPLAATVLTHVARLNEGHPVLDGLAVESAAYSMLLAGAEFKAWRRSHPPGPARPATEPVLVEWAGEAVTITLNRPEVRNAYDPGMRDALVDALRAVASHPGPIDVVLTGAGPDFCSGGDLSWFGAAADPVLAHAVRLARSPGPLLRSLSSTARLHGACIGAGIEVPAFCTRVEATPDAWLQLPEVSMGLIPGAGGTASIQARAGRHRLAWMALSGRRIDAAQALDWGLVDTLI
ncbi:MAG TPA: enoyl-CoA hydratase/isomerase family protein [Acidimicrobiales bacterium]|nr:enoyl-CoA hydratase/isomerase family protein [Acidimicrobiales bacterium]